MRTHTAPVLRRRTSTRPDATRRDQTGDACAGTPTAIAVGTMLDTCRHCHAAVAVDADGFCCVGCRAAFAFISAAGLEQYQLLADGPLPPGGAPAARPWLPAVLASASPNGRVAVDIQGLTCGACVWVVQKVADRRDVACLVNPGLGRLDVDGRDRARLEGFLDDIETLGYRTGPALKHDDGAADGLVLRAGISAGLAMAAMSFAFSRYFGLDDAGDEVGRVFFVGEIVTSSAAMIVGGSPFLTSAWRALKLGIVSFDVPVALGLVLAYVGSVVGVVMHRHDGVFFDSVAMFAALMVIGRLAQRRLLAKSRAQLLADSGLDGLPVTVLVDDVPVDTTASAVRAGDRLLVRPGDAVVVDSVIAIDDAANDDVEVPFSLAWITGESEARVFGTAAGHERTVPAGACHVGDRAVVVVASEAGTASKLAALLARHDDDDVTHDGWQGFARWSVIAVLLLAVVAAVVWSVLVDVPRGLAVATAVLVVTCPCALGLALPLVDELGTAALRRRGIFVRRGGFFARLAQITDVVFDKTGTLTAGDLVVDDDGIAALRALSSVERDGIAQMVLRSAHPKSRAVAAAIIAIEPHALRNDVVVVEVAGVGLDAQIGDHLWTLRSDGGTGIAVGRDGATVVVVGLGERLQRDARAEVTALRRRGLRLHLASGDRPERATAVAAQLGIDDAHGALHPDDKAALVEQLGREQVCFVGDGINDAAAFAVAGIAGTPALDRPQLPARADFYTVSAGLGPIDALFAIGARYDRAARTALWFAVAYNVVAVALALCGVLSPLACALLMPGSSIVVVLLVRAVFNASSDTQVPA